MQVPESPRAPGEELRGWADRTGHGLEPHPSSAHGEVRVASGLGPVLPATMLRSEIRSCVTFYLKTDGPLRRRGDPPGLKESSILTLTSESCNYFKYLKQNEIIKCLLCERHCLEEEKTSHKLGEKS